MLLKMASGGEEEQLQKHQLAPDTQAKIAAVLCVAHLDLMVQAHALQGAANVAQLAHKVILLRPPIGNLTLQAAAHHLFLSQRWLGPSCIAHL